MRALCAFLVLVLALPPIAADTSVCVEITEILAEPAGGDREFVEIRNCGGGVDLQGWKIRDAPTAAGNTNTYTFPSWPLAPGARVVVWGGGAPDGRGPAWADATVWNNAGDAVHLLDPAGTLQDWVGYGTTAAAANRTPLAKAPAGSSWQKESDWIVGPPSPGSSLGASAVSLEVVVANAPPEVRFVAAPSSARPGAALDVEILIHDPNGAADIAVWRLLVGSVSAATGTQGGPTLAQVRLPTAGLVAYLHLEATDQAGASANVTFVVNLRHSDLALEASSPIVFVGLPGSPAVSSGTLTLRNLAEQPLVPRLDVSAFSGPGRFPAEGALHVGWQVGNETKWIPYLAPLTSLPTLEVGATVQLSFRVDLPPGIPAGSYGTSLAVVP